MVALLLNRGADMEARDFLGRSCKETAEKHQNSRAQQVLEYWERYRSIPPQYLVVH